MKGDTPEELPDESTDSSPAEPADTSTGGSAAQSELSPAVQGASSGLNKERIANLLTVGTIGVLTVVALFAVLNLYTAVSQTINIWFTNAYAPLFRAAFNLVVLMLALAGLSLVFRREGSVFSLQ